MTNENWRSLQPTKKQLRFLDSLGYENKPKTRGECSEIISEYVTTRQEQVSRYKSPPSDYGMPLRGDMAQFLNSMEADCYDHDFPCGNDPFGYDEYF